MSLRLWEVWLVTFSAVAGEYLIWWVSGGSRDYRIGSMASYVALAGALTIAAWLRRALNMPRPAD